MATSRVQIPGEVRRGDAVEVKISVRHPMETGFRVDDTGKRIPRNTIRQFTCRYNGTPVFSASLIGHRRESVSALFHQRGDARSG